MQRRKFPAGSFVPGIFGWLCHVDSAQHPGFELSFNCWWILARHRKTMNFGSVLRLPSFGDLTLKANQVFKVKLQSSIGEPCIQACYSQYQGMLVSYVQ